jgi:Uma2 family endonuclease
MHRFSVDDYHQMIASGILTTDDKVELLDGWIVDKMAQIPPHGIVVSRIYRWLAAILSAEDWFLQAQIPITLLTSEPEPDITIARGPDTQYETRHPGPADIVIVIEVADSSLIQDREDKGPIYAAAKIREYWIVNLVDGCIECYTKPQGGRNPVYRQVRKIAMNEPLALVLDGKRVGELTLKQLMG